MTEDIRIPEIGEGVESGNVVAILKQPGDRIEVEEGIIEVETQKAVVEIPSPIRGTVKAVLVAEGDEVKVGDVVARVDTEADEDQAPATEATGREDRHESEIAEKGDVSAEAPPSATGESSARPAAGEPESRSAASGGAGSDGPPEEKKMGDGKTRDRYPAADARPLPASPSVRRLARELGVDLLEVTVPEGGRISEADVKAVVRKERDRPTASAVAAEAPAGETAGGLPDLERWGEVSAEELTAVRRLTADSLARAWRIVPHVTQFDEADVTGLQSFMRDHAAAVSDAGGKLTVTAVLAAICARALKRFPRFNAAIDTAGNRLIQRHNIHIGIAVETPRGLLVPVVRDADGKTITELAVEIFDLAQRARSKKVKPDELEGATFTISNQGGIGGTAFTPIVAWPQAAILGISRTRSLPRVVADRIEARRILPLALSYDHRILDGADAARFLRWICDSLTQPLTMHLD